MKLVVYNFINRCVGTGKLSLCRLYRFRQQQGSTVRNSDILRERVKVYLWLPFLYAVITDCVSVVLHTAVEKRRDKNQK